MVTVVDGGGGGGIFPDFNPMKTPPKTESKNGPSLKRRIRKRSIPSKTES